MRLKKIFLGTGIAILVLAVIYIGLHQYVRSKITNSLVEKVKTGELDYEEFSLNLWSGSIVFNQLSYQKNGMFIKTDRVSVTDFSYARFLLDKEIEIQAVELEKPEASLTKNKASENETKNTTEKAPAKKPVFVHQFIINEGSLRLSNDSIQLLKVNTYSAKVQEIAVTKKV